MPLTFATSTKSEPLATAYYAILRKYLEEDHLSEDLVERSTELMRADTSTSEAFPTRVRWAFRYVALLFCQQRGQRLAPAAVAVLTAPPLDLAGVDELLQDVADDLMAWGADYALGATDEGKRRSAQVGANVFARHKLFTVRLRFIATAARACLVADASPPPVDALATSLLIFLSEVLGSRDDYVFFLERLLQVHA